MLQAYSFQVEAIVGRETEAPFLTGRGFIICSAPDPEALVRDLLASKGLVVLEVHYTADPSPADVSHLPERKREDLRQQGWCMVLQGIPLDED